MPSRLIGHTVEARQHPSTVEVLYGGRVLCTMPPLRGAADHRIDYRHIIRSLVRKLGAFARQGCKPCVLDEEVTAFPVLYLNHAIGMGSAS